MKFSGEICGTYISPPHDVQKRPKIEVGDLFLFLHNFEKPKKYPLMDQLWIRH